MTISQKKLVEKIIDSGLMPPEMLTLMITPGCNLNCLHCLLECEPFDQAAPVPIDTVKRIIEEFAGLGGNKICITGGDPLTHPEWMDILVFSCAFEEFFEVCLQTNATVIHEDYINHFLSLPPDRFVLQISLDGAKPEAHDRLRGEGRFKSTLKALHMLSEAGLGKQIQIAFTEMSHNYDELPGMIELVHNLGLQRLVCGSLIKAGRSLNFDWISLPHASQVISLIKRYQNDDTFRDHYERLGNIAAIEWFKGRNVAADQICTCIKNPFISAYGMLYPCVMYLNDSLAIGGMHGQSLVSAIDKMLPVWGALPQISQSRSTALESCKDCPGRLHCGGGCMGRADKVHGDVMTVEDRCSLRKAVYSLEPF